MPPTLGKVVLDEASIRRRVHELSLEVVSRYPDNAELTVVAVLTGGLIFAADLVRSIRLPMQLHVVEAASYFDSTQPAGQAILVNRIRRDVRDHDVLIIDDIMDSGGTLRRVCELVQIYRPRTLTPCVLLRKPRALKRYDVAVPLVGFDLPSEEFVVGYGLDYRGLYRNLPELRVLQLGADP